MTVKPPFNQLNRKVRVVYVLGRDEFIDYVQKGMTPNASTMYRVFLPMILANKSGSAEVRIMDQFVIDEKTHKLNPASNWYMQWADMVIFARQNAIPLKESTMVVESLKEAGILVGFESDDNYFEIPESTYTKTAVTPEILEQTSYIAKVADFYISPNHVLNESNKKHSGGEPILMADIPNGVMFDEWKEAAKLRKRHKDLRIMLAGTKNHFVDWLSVFPVIEKVMSEVPNVHLHVVGISKADLIHSLDTDRFHESYNEDAQKVLDWITKLKGKCYGGVDLQQYPRLLNSISPDVAVISTQDTEFDRSKSTLKYVDYTMSGAAIVCKDLQPYNDELSSREVMFWETNDELFRGLKWLLESKGDRVAMVGHGEKFVKDNYSAHALYPLFVDAWEEAYKKKWGLNDAPLEVIKE